MADESWKGIFDLGVSTYVYMCVCVFVCVCVCVCVCLFPLRSPPLERKISWKTWLVYEERLT